MTAVMWGLTALLVAGLVFAALKFRSLAGLVRSKKRGDERDRVWDMLYGLNWSDDTTTNNYGFAPAEGSEPERFQQQMYVELFKLMKDAGHLHADMNIIEVSCGRGGGLSHLVKNWPLPVTAVGLDRSANAIAACRRLHAASPRLTFVEGNALQLPFADGSFDAVINVEASNDYGNYKRFYTEVARVLRPKGVFLYADTRRAAIIGKTKTKLSRAGFAFSFRDITENVMSACREDGERRRGLIKRAPLLIRLLFRGKLDSYAGLEGSKQYESFQTRFRLYLMTCAQKT